MTISQDLRLIHEDDTVPDTLIGIGVTVRSKGGVVGRVVSQPFIDRSDGTLCCLVAIAGKWSAIAYATADLEVVPTGTDRISGEPYAPDEEPLTPEQARLVIEEMRTALFPGYPHRR